MIINKIMTFFLETRAKIKILFPRDLVFEREETTATKKRVNKPIPQKREKDVQNKEINTY